MRALLLVLLASPVLAAEASVRLAMPELTPIGVSAERGSFYTEHLASRLNAAGVQVTTSKAMAQLLGVERQRQLLGCEANSSCMAEIAAALGADGTVFGEIAKVEGGDLRVNLKVVSGKDGRLYSLFQGSASNETELLELLDGAARQLANDTAVALGRTLTPLEPAGRSPQKAIGIALDAAGIASIATGAILLGLARSTAGEFPLAGEPSISSARAAQLASTGKTYQTAGFICLGVGAALAVTGIVLFVTGLKSSPASVALVPTAGGAAFAFGLEL